jgi:intein/homing endonuclease
MSKLKQELEHIKEIISIIVPICAHVDRCPQLANVCIQTYSLILDRFKETYDVPKNKRIIDAMTKSKEMKTYGEFLNSADFADFQRRYAPAGNNSPRIINMSRLMFLKNLVSEIDVFYIPQTIVYIETHPRKPASRSRSVA